MLSTGKPIYINDDDFEGFEFVQRICDKCYTEINKGIMFEYDDNIYCDDCAAMLNPCSECDGAGIVIINDTDEYCNHCNGDGYVIPKSWKGSIV